jgi:hypothetical protein
MIKADSIVGRSDERFRLIIARDGSSWARPGFGLDLAPGCFRLVYLAGEATLDDVFLGSSTPATYKPTDLKQAAESQTKESGARIPEVATNRKKGTRSTKLH